MKVQPPTTSQKRSMYRGDTLAFVVQVLDPTYGTPVDITGWEFWFSVKYSVADPDAYAVFADNSASMTGNVTIVSPPVQGKVSVRMPADKTRQFPDTRALLAYDVQGKDPAGDVRTIELGTVSVFPDVTRATT